MDFRKLLVDETVRQIQSRRQKKFVWNKQKEEEFLSIPIETLLSDDYFLGKANLYPEHKNDIIELYEERGKYNIHTFVDEEGIGAGKTVKAAAIVWLEIYQLVCHEKPWEFLGLAPNSKLAVVALNRTEPLAREVTYTELLIKFDCPFFNDYFPPKVDLAMIDEYKKFPKLVRFPKRVAIFPGTGSALSVLGYNIYSAVVDEANYMEIVERSAKVFATDHYDAAQEQYESLRNRMTSRGIKGLIAMISNSRFKGDLLDRMIKKAQENEVKKAVGIRGEGGIGDGIFWRRRATWEAKPDSSYCGKKFLFNTETMEVMSTEE